MNEPPIPPDEEVRWRDDPPMGGGAEWLLALSVALGLVYVILNIVL